MRALVLALCLALAPLGAGAQEVPPQSPVVIIESDRIFASSVFGRQVAAQIAAERAALAAENREILEELSAEEEDLTEQRASLDPVAFRTLTDAFDQKVTRLRREQDAKQRTLEARSEAARDQFLQAVRPVLEQIMQERGAVVMIERRNVVLDVAAVNITDEAIARIDAALSTP